VPSTTLVVRTTTLVDEYRKFIPQVAYVALAGWTLVADRLSDGKAIDGVTYVAVIVAVAQALVVVVPKSPVTKAVLSFVTALAAGVSAAITDGSISPAEAGLIVAAFLAWATGAGRPNVPAGQPVAPAEPANAAVGLAEMKPRPGAF